MDEQNSNIGIPLSTPQAAMPVQSIQTESPQPIEPSPVPPRQKMPMIVGIILLFVLLLLLGTGSYIMNMKKSEPTKTIVQPPTPSPTTIPTTPPLVSPASTTSVSAKSKTYTNSDFTFMYPSIWSLDPNNPLQLTNSQSNDDDTTPTMSWLDIIINNKSTTEMLQEFGVIDTKKQTLLDKNPATTIMGKSGIGGAIPYIATITTNNNKTYTIKLTTDEETLSSTTLSEFDQIVSTFRFTDQQKIQNVDSESSSE